ncbi:ribonuclease domain-containing protein [Streptomyces sp. ODS28]|uniref:ribonuclease domain-containing protein n=1 Tax=Streptomyces sp. ODS28 TaxID=3136688 RepID=UPI0031EEFAD7
MRFPPRITRIAAVTALAGGLLAGGPALAGAAVSDHAAPAHSASVRTAAAQADIGKICYKKLPSEAHDTLKLIEKGGPYPYPQDGTVFDNREGILPDQDKGYYHEFTVKTPGSEDRGARRIVTGDKEKKEDYYTADHYKSFDAVDYGC